MCRCPTARALIRRLDYEGSTHRRRAEGSDPDLSSVRSAGDLKRWARESFSALAPGGWCQKHDKRTLSIRLQSCPHFTVRQPSATQRYPTPRPSLNCVELITAAEPRHIHLQGIFRFLRPGQSGLVRFWKPAGSPPRTLGRSWNLGGPISTNVVPTAFSERFFAGNQAFSVPHYPTGPRTLPRN